MENASKALIIAGSVLLAMLIIGTLIFMFTNLSNLRQTEADSSTVQKLEEYNRQIELYNKANLYGSEILSLANLIEDYNVKLLSTKIYWDKPEQRENYKAFWKQYQEIIKLKDTDYLAYMKQKETLFITNDLKAVRKNENKYYKIIKFYKNKLVELGAMRELKNHFYSQGNYVGRKVECRN